MEKAKTFGKTKLDEIDEDESAFVLGGNSKKQEIKIHQHEPTPEPIKNKKEYDPNFRMTKSARLSGTEIEKLDKIKIAIGSSLDSDAIKWALEKTWEQYLSLIHIY